MGCLSGKRSVAACNIMGVRLRSQGMRLLMLHTAAARQHSLATDAGACLSSHTAPQLACRCTEHNNQRRVVQKLRHALQVTGDA